MFTLTPYILTASLAFSFAQTSLVPSKSETGVLTQLCSGKIIRLDLGEKDKPPPQPTHSKACHAVCCQKDSDDLNAPSDEDDPEV